MCGIAGIVSFDGYFKIHTDELQRMADPLDHRGPDDSGIYLDIRTHQCGLAHRRLSVIDIAGGAQPMGNADQTLWITYNGECYNFPKLRRRFQNEGHRFRTQSDTEVILKLYEVYGLKCVDHIRGMFAFAIWDQAKHRLFLARDRLGKKPLYYSVNEERFLFASECKALLQTRDFPRRPRMEAIAEFLLLNHVPAPLTAYQDIRQLPPAHIMIIDQRTIGNPQPMRYWSLPEPNSFTGTKTQAVDQIRETMIESTEMRLISDVKLGTFLSGGIDSAIVTGICAHALDEPVETFSIGFEDKLYNELPLAKVTAARHRTSHHEFLVNPDCATALPSLGKLYDDPFADSSALPTWYLSRQTRAHVTVALSGDGGDESFGGYDRYRAMRLAEQMRRYRLLNWLTKRRFWKSLGGSDQRGVGKRLQRLAGAGDLPPDERYLTWISLFHPDLLCELFEKTEMVDTIQMRWRRLCELFDQNCDPVTAAMRWDLQTYLPGDLNTKTDRASMAFGLEVRSPFQDHKVVELAATLPSAWRCSAGKSKILLRKAFPDLIPPAINRQPKRGFGVPLAGWFRGPLRNTFIDTVLTTGAVNRGTFRQKLISRLLEENDRQKDDHGQRLWALLMLELWHRNYIDG